MWFCYVECQEGRNRTLGGRAGVPLDCRGQVMVWYGKGIAVYDGHGVLDVVRNVWSFWKISKYMFLSKDTR